MSKIESQFLDLRKKVNIYDRKNRNINRIEWKYNKHPMSGTQQEMTVYEGYGLEVSRIYAKTVDNDGYISYAITKNVSIAQFVDIWNMLSKEENIDHNCLRCFKEYIECLISYQCSDDLLAVYQSILSSINNMLEMSPKEKVKVMVG